MSLNKHIQVNLGINFPVALSFLHMLFSTLVLRLLRAAGYIPSQCASPPPFPKPLQWPLEGAPHLLRTVWLRRHVSMWTAMRKGSLDCFSVAIMNISLSRNSVGTYQLSKMMLIPVTAVVQYVIWGITVSRMTGAPTTSPYIHTPACARTETASLLIRNMHPSPLLRIRFVSLDTVLALVPLCVGITLATATDFNGSIEGILWAAAAVGATVWSQLATQQIFSHGLDTYFKTA